MLSSGPTTPCRPDPPAGRTKTDQDRQAEDARLSGRDDSAKGSFIHVPLTCREASAYIAEHHRHHRPPQGFKAAIGASSGGVIVGVGVIGRPVARHLDDGWTAEITRVAVEESDRARHACSFLYGRLRALAFAMGYRRVITYTLPCEGGASLRGAGYRVVGKRGGGQWSRPSRPRVDMHPTEQKLLWEATA